jgi:hypothetical protein
MKNHLQPYSLLSNPSNNLMVSSNLADPLFEENRLTRSNGDSNIFIPKLGSKKKRRNADDIALELGRIFLLRLLPERGLLAEEEENESKELQAEPIVLVNNNNKEITNRKVIISSV